MSHVSYITHITRVSPPELPAEVRGHVVLHQEGGSPEAPLAEDALELAAAPRVGDGHSARLRPPPLLASLLASPSLG